ncbi:MAG: hypothetical protein RLZ62_1542 [Bacteroidota bacterium]|jgi:hypothetical protein
MTQKSDRYSCLFITLLDRNSTGIFLLKRPVNTEMPVFAVKTEKNAQYSIFRIRLRPIILTLYSKNSRRATEFTTKFIGTITLLRTLYKKGNILNS